MASSNETSSNGWLAASRVKTAVSICDRLERQLESKKQDIQSDSVGSFLPRLLCQQIIEDSSYEGTALEFEAEGNAFRAAVLFSDASGFTALTEKLGLKEGGVEILCTVINDFFGRLIQITEKYGGDIVKFSGDALTIVFPVLEDRQPNYKTGKRFSEEDVIVYSPDMRTATARAAQCSIEVHAALSNFPAVIEDDPSKNIYLNLHMGLGVGLLTAVHVGGIFNRWEYVVAGPPMTQIGIAEPLAKNGETVLSPEAWEEIQDFAEGVELDDPRGKFVRLVRILQEVAKPRRLPELYLRPEYLEIVKRYIPNAYKHMMEDNWLISIPRSQIAQVRDISVIFVAVQGVTFCADDSGDCSTATASGQALMLCIQRIVFRWEGSVNKMLVDDKGLLVIIVLGLPPLPHANDPYRAVRVALDVTNELPEVMSQFSTDKITCSAGVASGQAFCGFVGSSKRREYTVMGDTVNLSARLMAAASNDEGGRGVLIDESTCLAARQEILSEALEPMKLKGKEKRVPVFRPMQVQSMTETKDLSLLGRHRELKTIRQMFAMLHTYNHGGTLVLTGRRGSGLSPLVNSLVESGKAAGFFVLTELNAEDRAREGVFKQQQRTGDRRTRTPTSVRRDSSSKVFFSNGDLAAAGAEDVTAAEVDLPYVLMAWHGIMEQILKEGSGRAGVGHLEYLLQSLPAKHHPQISDFNAVLPGVDKKIPEQEGYVCLYEEDGDNEHFVDGLLEMMKLLILRFAEDSNVMIVFHVETGTSAASSISAHSWHLLRKVSQECTKRDNMQSTLLLALVADRTVLFQVDQIQDIKHCLNEAKRTDSLMHLLPLSKETQKVFTAKLLLIEYGFECAPKDLPDTLLNVLQDRAGGNPKGMAEMIKALFDDGALSTHKSELSQGAMLQLEVNKDLYSVPVPSLLLGYARQRLDSLSRANKELNQLLSAIEETSFSVGTILKMLDFVYELKGAKESAEQLSWSYVSLTRALHDLVDEFVLIQVDPVPDTVLRLDPSAKAAFQFQNLLLKEESYKQILPTEKEILSKAYLRLTADKDPLPDATEEDFLSSISNAMFAV
eukprot:gene10650-12597_t